MDVEREIRLEAPPEEVWPSLAEGEWLGPDASIDPRPAGEVRCGERSGFVEEVEEPRRLVFWWSARGEDATRVAVEPGRPTATARSCVWSRHAHWRSSICAAWTRWSALPARQCPR